MRQSISAWMLGIALMMAGQAAAQPAYEHRLLATSRTSTMEREMNQAADEGFRFVEVMGGETAADSELVVVMVRDPGRRGSYRYSYRLLATSRTSTMQNELQEAGADGYDYRGQTVYESFFGGDEIVVILERDEDASARFEYELLATTLTSTMEDELRAVGRRGFEAVGLTVGETAFGGDELVVITRRVDPR